jgi:hypothetical protein
MRVDCQPRLIEKGYHFVPERPPMYGLSPIDEYVLDLRIRLVWIIAEERIRMAGKDR